MYKSNSLLLSTGFISIVRSDLYRAVTQHSVVIYKAHVSRANAFAGEGENEKQGGKRKTSCFYIIPCNTVSGFFSPSYWILRNPKTNCIKLLWLHKQDFYINEVCPRETQVLAGLDCFSLLVSETKGLTISIRKNGKYSQSQVSGLISNFSSSAKNLFLLITCASIYKTFASSTLRVFCHKESWVGD